MSKIKLLSLWQPWASLCVWKNPEDGKAEKQLETRHCSTDYRGLIAIHATASLRPEAKFVIEMNSEIRRALVRHGFEDVGSGDSSGIKGSLNFGAIVGVVTLEKIVQFDELQLFLAIFPNRETHFGDHSPGRFGWYFTNPIEFKNPIYCRGLRSLGTPKPEIIEQILEQMEVSNAE
jgi:hypothetical protein